MRYIEGEELLIIHADIIDATGGAHGVRDTHLLGSLLMRPQTNSFGVELYPNLYSKGACYLESLARYHVFVDGNKRTAIAATARFLYINGYELTATNTELVRFILRVVVKKISLDTIAQWIKQYSRPLT